MIHMLRPLMGKVGNMQEQTGTISTEMETQRKNRQKKLEFKNTGTEMKSTCEGVLNTSRLGTAKESIHDFKDMSTETFKTEVQREKRRRKKNTLSRNCATIAKGVTRV